MFKFFFNKGPSHFQSFKEPVRAPGHGQSIRNRRLSTKCCRRLRLRRDLFVNIQFICEYFSGVLKEVIRLDNAKSCSSHHCVEPSTSESNSEALSNSVKTIKKMISVKKRTSPCPEHTIQKKQNLGTQSENGNTKFTTTTTPIDQPPPSHDENNIVLADRNQQFQLMLEIKNQLERCPLSSDSELTQTFKRLYRKLQYSHYHRKDDNSDEIPSEATVGIIVGPPYRHSKITCTYTSRVLKPVIFQTFDMSPPYLKLLKEIESIAKIKCPYTAPETSRPLHPIQFVYVNSDHITAINALVNRYFWSGVDMTFALDYPEFSCVALYRKIVIGFGFMAPGIHLNEAYINFLFVRPHWRQCGIGAFILYHLTQTCRTWDITLHVSPTNPAMMLYHKFGFKCQAMIRNFYSCFMTQSPNDSKNAFFMKLEYFRS